MPSIKQKIRTKELDAEFEASWSDLHGVLPKKLKTSLKLNSDLTLGVSPTQKYDAHGPIMSQRVSRTIDKNDQIKYLINKYGSKWFIRGFSKTIAFNEGCTQRTIQGYIKISRKISSN